MPEQMQISGPVSVSTESDSKQRVAYDLMTKILAYEDMDRNAPRAYLLTLYSQCLAVVWGRDVPQNIVERPSQRNRG